MTCAGTHSDEEGLWIQVSVVEHVKYDTVVIIFLVGNIVSISVREEWKL